MESTNINNNNRREDRNYYNSRTKKIVYDENNIFYSLLTSYIDYLQKLDYTKGTIYQARRQTICFLDYIEKTGIKSIKCLDNDIINKYLNNLKSDYTISTKIAKYKWLKSFVSFLLKNNYIEKDLSLFIPNIKTPRFSRIPTVWTEEEIKKIFSKIDRNTKKGKMLYAILIFALRYGLRISDITNLKFENFNWNKKTISIVQEKNKTNLTLPLLPDVADAVIDYIKNARIESSENYIFLNSKSKKYEHSNGSDNFHREILQLIKKSNLDLPKYHKKGIHSFRHTLASRMLNENIPLPIISSVLGHSSTLSTINYLKIDLKQLAKCCLELEDIYE